jgi:Uncharacterized protein conserved in bacteria
MKKSFGEVIRELRTAQEIGLRELAQKIGISPAYLSRIERGRELPPKDETIKKLAKFLAADPDVLFRLASSTDPEIVDYLHNEQEALNLLRYIKYNFESEDIKKLFEVAKSIKNLSNRELSANSRD